jgi:5-methylcytosine-specific restriction endonuclease McrA
VVREVYQRDAGQCTFVSAEGKRCAERGFLELHHHNPYARGGEATVENLRLVCRSHNALFADRDFGRSFIRSKRTQTREPVDELGLERVVQL